MSDEEIVTKAIKKAIEGGWQEPDDEYLSSVIFAYGGWADMESLGNQYEQWCSFIDARGLKDIIFNHGFARALWADEESTLAEYSFGVMTPDGEHTMTERASLDGWEFHLQQMVVAENPIQYLGENI